MSAARRSDVVINIRAVDETTKAVDTITNGIAGLLIQLKSGGGQAADFAKGLASVDKAYSALAGTADRGAQEFARVNGEIGKQRDQLKALQAQAAAAATALKHLNSDDTVINAGRDQSGRIAQVKAVTAEYDRLQKQIGDIARSIATQEWAVGKSSSSLQFLGSAANSAEREIAAARKELERYTTALDRQAAAAKVAGNVNTATGVNRGAATDNGASFEALAAREIATQKRREDAARAAAAAVRDSVITSTGANRGRATDNGAGFGALDQMMKAQEASAAKLRSALDPSLTIRKAYNNEIRDAIKLYRDELISVDELRKRIGQLREQQRGAQQAKSTGLLGLKPYELQNLSYQINDVFTQLASGTSLTQTLGQQGGQILQLFPRVGSAIASAFTSVPLITFAAGLTAIVVGVNRLLSNIAQLRQIDAILAGNADAAAYSAAQLQATAKQMREFGVSSEDAMKLVRLAIQRGLAQDEILDFGKAAKGLSILLGVDVTDAAGRLATALKGGFTSLQELNRQTNLFTADELKLIRQLFEQGKATEAAAKATDILDQRLAKVADTATSKTEKSARNLSVAWNELLDTFSKVQVFGDITSGLADIADGAARAINGLRGVRSISDVDSEINQIQRNRDQMQKISQAGGDPLGLGKMQIDGFDRQLAALRKEREALEKAASGTSGAAGKVAADAATQRRQAANDDVAAATKLLSVAGQITTQAQLTAKIDAERIRLNTEAAQRFPDASNASRAAYVDAQLAQTRVGLEKQLAGYRKSQADDAERAAKAAASFDSQAFKLIAGFESFKAKSYFDRTAFRVGYGSDTTTSATGQISRVTSATTTTQADATRDLTRRIKEFSDTAKRQVGADRFAAFSPQQQAALTSIAYNYGRLPERILAAVRTGTAEEIAAAVRGLGDDNNGINRGRRNREADILANPNFELTQSTENLEEQRLEVQAKFNAQIDDENEKRRLAIASLQAEVGLTGEGLLTEQKRQAVAEAVLKAQQDLDRINADRGAKGLAPIQTTLAEEQRAEIEKTTAAYFDLAHARDAAEARKATVDNPVSDLSAQRDVLQQQLQFYRETGNRAMADQLQPRLDIVNASLRDAINNAIAFYSALKPGDDPLLDTQAKIDSVISRLQLARDSSVEWINVLGISGQTIAQTFASDAVNALDQFAQSVAAGRNAFKSLGQAFAAFAGQFLRQIAQMIQQQLAFRLISGLVSIGAGAVGGGTSGLNGSTSALAGLKAHSGGIVGDPSTYGPNTGMTLVNPAWFANARRYHTGGIAGLAANEVPAVLQRGEEVLTANDARHSANGGGAGGGDTNIKNIVLFDPAEAMSQLANTKVFEKSLLTTIKNSPGAFKAALG